MSTNIFIGDRHGWGGRHRFGLHRADRRQHVYVIGKTGTGKSMLLLNMISQEIEAGAGLGVIDPHGDLAETVLDLIPPYRMSDVLYFNPADIEHPVGFNPLRMTDGASRHLVASSIVSAFKHQWSENWGPRLEYILYCSIAALVCVESATLLGINRLLTDSGYREWVLRQVDDPLVRSFWEREFAGYDKRLMAEAIAPIQNKVGQLVMSPVIRNIVGQVRSRFEPRFMMDNRRILIANLAKGKLGEDTSNLLGSLLVTAFQLAAMSRSDALESARPDWTLYVDEFQHFGSDSFASILSEARKYRLGLVLSHQHTSQLRPEIRDAVLGNVGTTIAFRVSESDARLLAREYGRSYSAESFTGLDNYTAYIKPLVDGNQAEPFMVMIAPPPPRRFHRREGIIRRTRHSYAMPRRVAESKIHRWIGNRRY